MFGIDTVAMAIGFAVALPLALLVVVGRLLWQHKLSRAFFMFGITLITSGVASVLVYQAQWASYQFGDPEPGGWALLPDAFYAMFFIVGMLFIVASGVVVMQQWFAAGGFTNWFDRRRSQRAAGKFERGQHGGSMVGEGEVSGLSTPTFTGRHVD
jgi:hypothetical protein